MHGNYPSVSAAPIMVGDENIIAQAETTPFFLEVNRGRTVFRRRPITNKSFLIGSGEHCDLQLGGQEIPLLFAMIQVDGEELKIRSLETEPGLKVNGRVVTSAALADGDHIEIGSFEFVARKQEVPDPAMPSAYARRQETSSHEHGSDLSELSAADLLDRLENDLNMVEDFERGERQGWAALMERVERRKDTMRTSDSRIRRQKLARPARQRLNSVDELNIDEMFETLHRRENRTSTKSNVRAGLETDYMLQIEQIVNELGQVTSDLEERSDQMSQRDLQYLEAASTIMESQQKLAEQLQSLIEYVDQSTEKQDKKVEPFETPRRAIA
ncbi:MAG: FHA domain-containing protein [Planctomycetota bacterium]|nr:FHA domain-containing protein [Planctomycetota bacterium]MDA1211968.1 FHA domain-containing protein [Planctomycetota bacterium]